ncbi:hypothetical protein HYW46_03350 [Candidatus Daviesbacteria bacterium]|nr:hypothetical protein [Candidatus Daviesbacteria bacterium]
MINFLKNVINQATGLDSTSIIIAVGAATFFFGFGAGALYNYYLILTNSPIVSTLRTSLTFKSAIFGDGIILPIINMTAAYFLIKNRKYRTKTILVYSFISGFVVLAYFHITQAVKGLVNWAMPSPWHWNLLGLWHAIYMYSVASFISYFYFTSIKSAIKEKKIPLQLILVTIGMITFFILLDLDYR